MFLFAIYVSKFTHGVYGLRHHFFLIHTVSNISNPIYPNVCHFIEPVTATTTVCPSIVCSTAVWIQNPSSNYQVEQLNITCSPTLVNMSIIQTIQRTSNETHAQQYQTFWNGSTNMTYSQTPTQLTYFWNSIPGMHIVKESFPNFVETQFFYTPGSVRNTSGDTWQMWLQSICGEIRYFSGTY